MLMKYIVYGVIILVVILLLYWYYKKRKSVTAESMANSQMPPKPTQQEMEEMQQRLQEILPYNLKDEQEIAKQLPSMTDQEMAKYADKITVKNINDTKFLDTVMPADIMQKLEKAPFSDERAKPMLLNPAVFGNFAFVSLHAPEPYSSRAKSALDFLKTKL
jgi:hypothetical protein